MNPVSIDANTKLICTYYDGCSLGDLDILRRTMHEEVTHYFLAPNPGSQPVSGREHLSRYWRKVQKMIEARWVVENSVTMGNQTVIEWTMFWKPAGAGERIATRGAEWFVLKDDLIYEIRSYYRQETFTTELEGFDYAGRGYSTAGREFSRIHNGR